MGAITTARTNFENTLSINQIALSNIKENVINYIHELMIKAGLNSSSSSEQKQHKFETKFMLQIIQNTIQKLYHLKHKNNIKLTNDELYLYNNCLKEFNN